MFSLSSNQSELFAARHHISDVTMQPSSDPPEEEEDDYEDDYDDEEEEWVWGSAGGDLTKRYNRTTVSCQVRHF